MELSLEGGTEHPAEGTGASTDSRTVVVGFDEEASGGCHLDIMSHEKMHGSRHSCRLRELTVKRLPSLDHRSRS